MSFVLLHRIVQEGRAPYFSYDYVLTKGLIIFRWLPLAPLVADNEAYSYSIEELVVSKLRSGIAMMIGIDALHHIPLARRLEKIARAAGTIELLNFFGDIHLYVANRLALTFFTQSIPRLAFAYSWIEARDGGAIENAAIAQRDPHLPPLCSVGPGFNAPLFISKACLLRHHIGNGRCPVPCPRRMNSKIKDRERQYITIVEDCISMMFVASKYSASNSETKSRQ